MTSSSAEYYRTHPAAMARKAAYDTKFESSPAQKAKRRELEKYYIIDLHDEFMHEYGWIPLEEFRKLPIITVMNLIGRINLRRSKEPPICPLMVKKKK